MCRAQRARFAGPDRDFRRRRALEPNGRLPSTENLPGPYQGDVAARAQSSVGGNESEVAIEAMGDQHAIERIAVVPIESARRLRVRSVDRELEKPRRQGRGARRSLERELPGLPLDRDLPERGGADIDVRLLGDGFAQAIAELRRFTLEPEKDVGVDEEAHSSPANRRSISGSGASKSSAMKLMRISFEGLRARLRGPSGASRALATPFLAMMMGVGRVLTTSDVVAIRIVDHPDLDWTARIEPDGTINFPYVGRIKAAGLTEDDLARTVERRLVELKIIAEP